MAEADDSGRACLVDVLDEAAAGRAAEAISDNDYVLWREHSSACIAWVILPFFDVRLEHVWIEMHLEVLSVVMGEFFSGVLINIELRRIGLIPGKILILLSSIDVVVSIDIFIILPS